MIRFGGNSWQLILADLALILFLVTLAALAFEEETAEANATASADQGRAVQPLVAPSQALFRPTHNGPSLSAWLAQRPRDSRATLTIFAQHSGSDRAVIWEEAELLATSAAQEGFGVRVVITRGNTSDLHASLAYDAPE